MKIRSHNNSSNCTCIDWLWKVINFLFPPIIPIVDDSSVENEHVDVVINIRELDDVLMRDVGNKIADSGK